MVEISAKTWKKCVKMLKNTIKLFLIILQKNKKELWLKMHGIQVELCIKNMFDLVIKEIYGNFNIKNPTE